MGQNFQNNFKKWQKYENLKRVTQPFLKGDHILRSAAYPVPEYIY